MLITSGRNILGVALTALATLVAGQPASAQARPIPSIPRAGAATGGAETKRSDLVRATRIETSTQRTPEYSVTSDEQRVKGREWAKIMVTYDTAPDWIDEMEIRYYVGVKNKKTGAALIFQTSVTYIDVARGSHTDAVFLSPSSLERYGNVEAVAAEFFIDREKAALIGKPNLSPNTAPWWSGNNVRNVEGRLLNRAQTPFAFVAIDGYSEIKQQK